VQRLASKVSSTDESFRDKAREESSISCLLKWSWPNTFSHIDHYLNKETKINVDLIDHRSDNRNTGKTSGTVV